MKEVLKEEPVIGGDHGDEDDGFGIVSVDVENGCVDNSSYVRAIRGRP